MDSIHRLYMYVYVRLYMFIYIAYLCIYIYIYTLICIYTYAYKCIYISLIYVYIYTLIYVYIYTLIYASATPDATRIAGSSRADKLVTYIAPRRKVSATKPTRLRWSLQFWLIDTFLQRYFDKESDLSLFEYLVEMFQFTIRL